MVILTLYRNAGGLISFRIFYLQSKGEKYFYRLHRMV